jgi:hypothetical protein
MRHSAQHLSLASGAITVEGALIAPPMLARIATQTADGQTEADYLIPKGLALRDEIARYFRVGQALFTDLHATANPSLSNTIAFVESFARDVLGFVEIARVGTRSSDDRVFAVTLECAGGRVPMVVVPPADELDKPSDQLPSDGRRHSAASELQDWLNANENALWGICCNGHKLRLLRDNPSLTRPAYIEADLRRILEDESFADFTTLWLLLHSSRFGSRATNVSECAIEKWRESGQREGITARSRLRDGVKSALVDLGTGFLSNERNAPLRERVRTGDLPLAEFFGQLLRLVYRLIFLLTAEDRGLLHDPLASIESRTLYSQGYSVGRLRDNAVRRAAWNPHTDRWEGLLILFSALARGEARLGLPALGGLFETASLPDLENARLSNQSLMSAIYRLAWLREQSGLVRVNWRDMETEELGSVYESLLELIPRLTDDARAMSFASPAESAGHARKITSSYYTPDSLVQKLLDGALEPILDRIEAEADDPCATILELTFLDPACGSGHFLLAAARRIASRLARIRSQGLASAGEFRRALRDVTRSCIHGVDRNPMAVELAKVALWIETVDPGKPLGFLDANIRCGDALLGVFDLALLRDGVPEAAFKPLAGDDKPTARHYALRNRDDLTGQGRLQLHGGDETRVTAATLANARASLRALPEDSPEQVAERRHRFEHTQANDSRRAWAVSADLFVAAFLLPKTLPSTSQAEPHFIPTTNDLWRALTENTVDPRLSGAVEASRSARAFHWQIEFPDVAAAGGFDVVLGNPPWDTMSPDVKEFFSPYDPDVRFLSPEDQKARIDQLMALPGVAEAWNSYCYRLYALANFFKESGRYTLFAEGNLGKGDFNVYRMFTELALRATKAGGRAAQLVPENLYNGANAAAIRRFLFDTCKLHQLIGFENTRRVWFDIDVRAKFCLYVAEPGSTTNSFEAAFGINSREKLAALTKHLPIEIPVSLVEEFSPEAIAIAEVAHPSDISISRKLYARLPKFGASFVGAVAREYMREIDMGNDREDFGNDPEGIPLYEGRMVDLFDHRAKMYVSGRGRSAVWRQLPFGSPDKAIRPQWRISDTDIPQKASNRWLEYRIGFCDVASPTNQRALVAALIPPHTLCGHKVPTILFTPRDDRLMLLWLGLANSFCLDFLVRKKVALTMSYTLMDSLPLPRRWTGSFVELEIATRVLALSATGPEMLAFRNRAASQLGLIADNASCEDQQRRTSFLAELDVLVARDFFGLTRDEIRYLLDPEDILGAECGFETFGALKRAEMRVSGGAFTTRDLILKTWLTLPRAIDLTSIPDGARARPAPQRGDVGAPRGRTSTPR